MMGSGDKKIFAYVGCFTTERRKASGKGIRVYRITGGNWELIQEIPACNPGFLTFSPDKRFLYSSHGDCTYVTAYRRNADTGMLEKINSAPSGGLNGAFVSCASSGERLYISNFGNGILSAVKIDRKEGAVLEVESLLAPEGENGPLKEQNRSQPHQIVEGPGGFLYACDRGKDAVHVLRWNDGIHAIEYVCALDAHPALGPRHMAFHPDLPVTYVFTEFSNEIVACHTNPDTGVLTPFQRVSSLPDSFVHGASTGAEVAVHPSGKYVYCSNRGHDSICRISLDQDGRMGEHRWFSCEGSFPWFFMIDEKGENLICCNEGSGDIRVFGIRADSGDLVCVTVIPNVPSPSCILLADAE